MIAVPSRWLSTALALTACLIPAPVAGQEPPPEKKPAGGEEAVQEPAPEQEKDNTEEAAKGAGSPYLAVVGGDVHTVTRGLLPGGTVLIKDGRILKVGTGIRIPEGARILDASGMQVYPGLVAVDARGFLGSGKRPEDGFDPFGRNVALGLAGGLTTVQQRNAVGKLTRGTLEGHLVATDVWVGLSYSTTSPASRRRLRASLDRCREYLRQRRAWELARARQDDSVPEPSDKGLDKKHLELLQGRRIARFTANSMKDLLAVCDLLEEYPMKAVVFGAREGWLVAERLGRAGAWAVLTPRAKAWPDERLSRPSGWSIENARILHEHGVPFAILPTQLGISTGGIAGRDLLTLPMEAAFAIRGGLPEDAALRSLTLDAARILGLEDRIGSLEPGKDGDLIVCDGDLFDYRTFVQWAVVNGRVVYDKEAMPYFAHIRPRPSPAAEVLERLGEQQPATGGEVDAPEGGGS